MQEGTPASKSNPAAAIAKGYAGWSYRVAVKKALTKINRDFADDFFRSLSLRLAEVAIPLPLFAENLQLIAGLRPRPAPT